MPYNKRFAETLYNKEWLKRVYVDENRNASQVAVLIDCDKTAVIKAVKRFGLPIKSMSDAQKLAPHPGSHAPRPRMEFKETLHNREWLQDKFINNQMTATQIANEAGSSIPSVCEAIQKHLDIKVSSLSVTPADVKAEARGRRAAYLLFPDVQPCIICGDKGTRNHIDANVSNNDSSNIEWLCMSHHLMVDKRLQAKSARYVKINMRSTWMEWHDEILENIKINPNTPTRNHHGRMLMPGHRLRKKGNNG